MYLSKVIIARAWSRDLYQLHQGLWHLFPNRPDAARDFLFHVEKRNTPEGCHVLLQSAQMPVSTAVATVIKTKQVEFQLQGNDSNLLIVFYVQIMPDDFVMQLHRF